MPRKRSTEEEKEVTGIRPEDIVVVVALVAFVVAIGTIGYYYTTRLGMLDSFYSASMILSGVGPVTKIYTTGGKYFSSFYALFGALIFVIILTLLLQRAIALA